jgi:hypothetical protein
MIEQPGQPDKLESPIRFLVAVFPSRQAAERALQALQRHGTPDDDIFIFHFRAPQTLADCTVRELQGAQCYPLATMSPQGDDVAIGTAARHPAAWRSMVLVYLPIADDHDSVAAVLRETHGYLLEADVDISGLETVK